MACTEALELDLADFLARPDGVEWTAFRDHYPRCRDCAVHVRTWTELTTALAADAHPDPATLVRFVDAEASLSAAERSAVARHLTACAACRDEAKTLGAFDLTAVAPGPAPRRVPARRRRGALRVLWHPALAYAAALVAVVYPFLSGRMQVPAGDVRGARREFAKEERPDDATPPPASRAAKAKEAPAVAPPPESKRLGERDAAAPTPSSSLAVSGLERARQAAPGRVAIVLAADAERTVPLADDGPEVTFVIAGMETRPLRNLRRLDGSPASPSDVPAPDPARVPARWLAPGRYAVDVIDPAGKSITVTFRVARP
jgi:hypothetical protein